MDRSVKRIRRVQLYLLVCRTFPVDHMEVELGKDFPHGAVGAGQGVGDGQVQDAPGAGQNHSARRAHGSWTEQDTDMRSRTDLGSVNFRTFTLMVRHDATYENISCTF